MTNAHSDFTALIAPHLAALFRAAYRLTGNRLDAEDLVQEVCLRAYAEIATLRSFEQPKGWLFKVAYRAFVDGVRRHARSRVKATGEDFDATRSSDEPSPEEAVEGELAERRLLDAFGRLDRDQRALLALHVEGHNLDELRAITDLSTDVLKARLYRARVRLGKLLAAETRAPALALEK